ncbi:MAG TPA: 30S ribosomal protein S6 [Terrimicrobiaceae bacterium]
MKRRYETLLALSTRGKDESVKEIIERLEKTFAAEGAAVEQIQRFEKRDLAYPLKHLNSAYFVNFIFEIEPLLVDKLRAKLKLDEDIALQNYLVLPQKRQASGAAA